MRNISSTLLKVAIVDDSMIVIERLRVLLSDIPCAEVVGYACNIELARQLISRCCPDVIVLDIYLSGDSPMANGLDLLASEKKENPERMIIMLTNMVEEQYRERCMKLGADYFFDKTNEFEKVAEVIRANPVCQDHL